MNRIFKYATTACFLFISICNAQTLSESDRLDADQFKALAASFEKPKAECVCATTAGGVQALAGFDAKTCVESSGDFYRLRTSGNTTGIAQLLFCGLRVLNEAVPQPIQRVGESDIMYPATTVVPDSDAMQYIRKRLAEIDRNQSLRARESAPAAPAPYQPVRRNQHTGEELPAGAPNGWSEQTHGWDTVSDGKGGTKKVPSQQRIGSEGGSK